MKEQENYCYYSKLLKAPFDSLKELEEAEKKHEEELRAKEDKAEQKRLDAKKVEEALKEYRKAGNESSDKIREAKREYLAKTADIKKAIKELEEGYQKKIEEIRKARYEVAQKYKAALSEFTNKYHEGFHMTLKDDNIDLPQSEEDEINQVLREIFGFFFN